MRNVWRAALAVAAAAAVAVAVATRRRRRTAEDAHDRLGVRRHREHGAVRRPGARNGEVAHRDDQQDGRDEGEAPHLQHAGQQAGDRQGLRGEASVAGRERDHDHLRRRLRRTGGADGDQRRKADGRGLHRHRPDGAEALRRQGPSRLLVRQRRPGRGLRDGGVRVEEGLADRVARDRHRDRLLPQRRPGVQGPLGAARRQDRDRGDLPVGRRQSCLLAEHRHAGSMRSRPTSSSRRPPRRSGRRCRS